MTPALGISGRIAAFFQTAQITPLLASMALLLGCSAVLVTPREEEPQINVTMANVLIPFAGAGVRDVKQMVAIPAEQVLSQINRVKHVMSVARPSLTVLFKVGVARADALVRLYDTVNFSADWLSVGSGVLAPIIKPKGIEDAPIVTLTLFGTAATKVAYDLERVAHHQPTDSDRDYATKWDGEWQMIRQNLRDTGAAYAVGLVLIDLLVVAQFGSYLTPLIIMAPIPLTIDGVMPGHALPSSQHTATSMIGMIALAGIIVRNSILLVDYIDLRVSEGMDFKEAVVHSTITRAQPIMLTGLAAMFGAFFILDDPIFNGLTISLVFGILVLTVLTLVVIPLLYFVAYRNRLGTLTAPRLPIDAPLRASITPQGEAP